MIWKRSETGIEVGSVTLYSKRVRLITLLRRLWPRQQRYRVMVGLVFLLAVVVLGPYVFSRAMSASRALSVEAIDGVLAREPSDPARSIFRVACYNIAHGRGLAKSNWDGGSADERIDRLDAIATLLREIDADVVVLNEVDFDTSWSHSVDQAQYLAKRAGYPYCAKLRNLDFVVGFWRWRFGNAVIARYPIVNAYEIDQPGYSRGETTLAGKKRSLFCEIQTDDRTLGIIAVHLSHRSEDLRTASAQRLIDFTKSYDGPLIIAGDFNSTPTDFPLSKTGQDGVNAFDLIDGSALLQRSPEQRPTSDEQYTFSSDNPRNVIDWILVSNSITIAEYTTHDSTLSDHRPVVADLMFNN